MTNTTLMTAVLAVGLIAPGAFADVESHRQAAVKLLEVTHTQKMLDQMLKSVEQMMDSQLNAVKADVANKEAIADARAELMEWMPEFFEWDQMKLLYVDIYTEVFTEEELNDISGFYESELGKKMIERMPMLMQKSMEKTQAMFGEKMPAFQKRLKEVCTDLERQPGE